MSEELKPCPFCGNTKMLVYEEKGKFGFTEWIVECDSHYCACQPIAHDSYQTKEEAIAAWNTRAERTCKIENAGKVPENILESETVWFCSECGSPIYNDMTPSYCIYCGARVVD